MSESRDPQTTIKVEVDHREVDYCSQGQPVRLTAELAQQPPPGERYRCRWTLPAGARQFTYPGQNPEEKEILLDTEGVAPGYHPVQVEVIAAEDESRVIESSALLMLGIAPLLLSSTLAQGGGLGGFRVTPGGVANAVNTGANVVSAVADVATAIATHEIADHLEDMGGPGVGDGVNVSLNRTQGWSTDDIWLWLMIKQSSDAFSFRRYSMTMNSLLCGIPPTNEQLEELGPDEREYFAETLPSAKEDFKKLRKRRYLPFNDTDAYRFLKVATEAFLIANVATLGDSLDKLKPYLDYAVRRLSLRENIRVEELQRTYLEAVQNTNGDVTTIPYLALVVQKLQDAGLKSSIFAMDLEPISSFLRRVRGDEPETGFPEKCYGILQEKLSSPLLLELIWSYWHEEGMLVQTMNAISRRFQNVRSPEERDPLAAFETDPLRPLNNLLWGYLQDEQHRLSVVRRVYEYDHHYGLSLYGQAVPPLHPADSRSRFLEAFHNLLYICTNFYQQDDDTTVIADGFPVLNGLKEVHLLLSEGAHNQFGDLPATARQEMLIQQWLLARPEFREFLPTRVMVAYPEPWMDRVDAMKSVQNWTDTSVIHFHNLAVFGEQILLSIRYGAWSISNDPQQAVNWARFWRPEIQGYTHAYRAVTGVDLTADVTTGQLASERVLPPSTHLRRQLEQQKRRFLPAPSTTAVIRPVATSAPRRLPARQ
jgi:hypothetical protein